MKPMTTMHVSVDGVRQGLGGTGEDRTVYRPSGRPQYARAD